MADVIASSQVYQRLFLLRRRPVEEIGFICPTHIIRLFSGAIFQKVQHMFINLTLCACFLVGWNIPYPQLAVRLALRIAVGSEEDDVTAVEYGYGLLVC